MDNYKDLRQQVKDLFDHVEDLHDNHLFTDRRGAQWLGKDVHDSRANAHRRSKFSYDHYSKKWKASFKDGSTNLHTKGDDPIGVLLALKKKAEERFKND